MQDLAAQAKSDASRRQWLKLELALTMEPALDSSRDAHETDGRGFLARREDSQFLSINAHLKSLDELGEVQCLLALGDPGLGKSWK